MATDWNTDGDGYPGYFSPASFTDVPAGFNSAGCDAVDFDPERNGGTQGYMRQAQLCRID
jgi:hypothetical protein